ncbi:MAG: hypothetical protein FD123_3745 [Bacteroidetes bacterium]|nr:MAG: hypothetical protein FD123_3745 [Bacteroidota bacterium]
MRTLLFALSLLLLSSCGTTTAPGKKTETGKGETWSTATYDYESKELWRFDVTFLEGNRLKIRADKNMYLDNDPPFEGIFKIHDTIYLDEATKPYGGLLLVSREEQQNAYTYIPMLRAGNDRMRLEIAPALETGNVLHSYHRMDENSSSRYYDNLDSLRAYVAIFEDDFYFMQTQYFFPAALYDEMITWSAAEIKNPGELKAVLAEMRVMVDSKFPFYDKMKIEDPDGYQEDFFISKKQNPFLSIENVNAVYRENLEETKEAMEAFIYHTPAMERQQRSDNEL